MPRHRTGKPRKPRVEKPQGHIFDLTSLLTGLSENISSKNPGARFAKYGLTVEGYAQMYVAQHGRCAICRDRDRSAAGLVVDHNHGTGRVRGLLCARCNSGLGMFGDKQHNLRRAWTYLKHHNMS